MATCARNSCRRQRLIDRQAESQRQRREVLEAEARALRERAGLDHKIEDAESFRLTPIPRNDGRSRRLPAKRRRALRAHLIRVLHEAMSHEEALRTGAEVPRAMFSPLEVPSEDLGRVLQIACTACRGQCCRAGDEHAYITADTLLTYRRAHPGLAFDAIVDAYMAHVPGNTLQPGCVYQHAHGCMLPRDMRGDTCNRHFCQELKELKRSVGTQDVPKLFFVPTRDQNFSRAVFVAPMLVKIARRVSDPAS